LLNPQKERLSLLASQDLNKELTDMEHSKIYAISKQAKMVQLLLSLSQPTSTKPSISDFGKSFLKRRVTPAVQPTALDTRHSDQPLVQNSKVNRNYTLYDWRSFENKEFPAMIREKHLKPLDVQKYNDNLAAT